MKRKRIQAIILVLCLIIGIVPDIKSNSMIAHAASAGQLPTSDEICVYYSGSKWLDEKKTDEVLLGWYGFGNNADNTGFTDLQIALKYNLTSQSIPGYITSAQLKIFVADVFNTISNTININGYTDNSWSTDNVAQAVKDNPENNPMQISANDQIQTATISGSGSYSYDVTLFTQRQQEMPDQFVSFIITGSTVVGNGAFIEKSIPTNSNPPVLLYTYIPYLDTTVAKGSVYGTTKITASTNPGNHLAYKISNTPAAIPSEGDIITGATTYISESDISGVDATTNKYIGIYELDGDNRAVKFKKIELTADNINDTMPSYTVSFNSNGGSSVTSIPANYDTTITAPTAPTKTGHTFGGWYRESGLSSAWNFSTDKVVADTTLYAKWDVASYTVSFNSNGGSSVTSIPANYDTTITAPTAPTKTGHTFGGWYKESGLSSAWNFSTDKVVADTTLYAKWDVASYTVSFNSNGGSSVTSIPANYDTTITAPTAPTKTGHTFGDWYKESGLSNAWNFSTDKVTADTTLYAKWNVASYTVSFNSNGGSSVTSIPANYDTTITAPTAPTKTGHTFGGWYKESGLSSAWNFSTDKVVADTTLYAKWDLASYTVSFNSNGGSSVTSIPASYDTTITAPTAPTKTGHTFGGWYKESGLSNVWNFSTDKVAADTTLYAKWDVASYTVSFNSNGGSSVTSIPANYDTTITAPTAPTKTGHTFGGWYKESGLSTAWNFSTDKVAADTTLYAKWNVASYTVSFNSNGGSSVTSIPASYDTTITAPTAPTNTGYTFGGWYKESGLSNAWNFSTDKITADTTLFAKWNVASYTVSFNSNGGSSVTSIPANYDTTITAPTAPTKTGYTFGGWYKESGLSNAWNFTTDKVAVDTTLYAKWDVASYTVSFNSNGGSSVTSIPANYDTTITAPTAPTKTGYTFGGWYKESGLSNVWNFSTDKITADMTLFAKWNVVNCTVSFNSNGGSSVTSIPANYDTTITAPTAPTKTGYTFGGWYKESGLSNAWNFSTDKVAAETTLYAKWNVASAPTPVINVDNNNKNETTEKITVEVKEGESESTAAKINVERATDQAGNKTDSVTFEAVKATETITKLKESGQTTARVVIPDAKDEVAETKVSIPSTALETLAQGSVNLKIETANASILIPNDSLVKTTSESIENLYFNLVPVKQEEQKNEIVTRTKLELSTMNQLASDRIAVLGRPVEIETNMPSTKADIILPLNGIELPKDAKERDAFLSQLGVFIEHSDGEKEFVKGKIVEYKEGVLGIQFTIRKFSTFTIVKVEDKSSACNITKVTVPAKSTMKKTKVTATVANATSSSTIKLTVSKKASWNLYLDKKCTKLVKSKKVALEVGKNQYYIKVTAQDGTAKVYTLTVERKEKARKIILVATKYDFADATAGSVLAAQLKGKVVLTGITDQDAKKMTAYIKKHYKTSDEIYIIGLGKAVSGQLDKLLKQEGYTHIKNIGGENKYETAAIIAKEIKLPKKVKVVLINGEVEPKERSTIETICAKNGYPILYVKKDSLGTYTKEVLKQIQPEEVYLIGGENTISDQVVKELKELLGANKVNITRNLKK